MGSGVSEDSDKANRNILHFLARQCMQQRLSEVLVTIHVRLIMLLYVNQTIFSTAHHAFGIWSPSGTVDLYIVYIHWPAQGNGKVCL